METGNIGLTSEQAAAALAAGQGNVQVDTTSKTVKDIVKENTLTYFNLIFAVLAVLLVVAGSFNSLSFVPIIIANTLIGIFQEINAKNVLDKLSIMNEPTAVAMRDGKRTVVSSSELVLGDVILLKGGVQIAADAVVLRGEISVNEALLTGEADEIVKKAGAKLMSGSFVVSGECLARLTHVGEDSYISKLTLRAKDEKKKEPSEMIRSIDRFVIFAGIAIIPIGITLLVQSMVVQHLKFQESVTSMVAAVIGIIPEGLYLLVSVTLAVSAVKLARKQIMLHEMKSIESLARVDVLCVDKTGTITDNSMLVADAVPAIQLTEKQKDAFHEMVGRYINVLPDDNVTMQALRTYFQSSAPVSAVSYLPFSSKYKYSSVQFSDATYIMGAPEIVMASCYDTYRSVVEEHARKGNRVLVFARYLGSQPQQGWKTSQPVPKDGLKGKHVQPILFILLQNPIRENAPETFAYFVDQGVEVKVISGDNPITVSEVAKKAGIPDAALAIDASQLTDMDMVRRAVRKYTVFGRVTPEQKRQIVRALQEQGRKVAMTGDGVNDILAMKDADCSIAMAAGSDAAVQAAQVVLLDSDFSHMPEMVTEGRQVINNIQRSATLFTVKNLFSLFLAVFSIIQVLKYPLTPSQITLISMFNIGIPAFVLAMEPNSRRIEGRFMRNVLFHAMPAALTDFLAIAALVIFGSTFGVADIDVSVAATFLLAIVGFIILIYISAPMNRFHSIVILGCIAGLIICAVLMSGVFDITYISKECVMLFVLFAIATEPFMRYLTKLFAKIEEKTENGRTAF